MPMSTRQRRGKWKVSLAVLALFILGLTVANLSFWRSVLRSTVGWKSPVDRMGWLTDFQTAARRAKNRKRRILIDFYAAWCAPCRRMERDVWSDEKVDRAVQRRFIPLRADVDTPAGKQLVRRYKVRALPTILIVSATGNLRRVAWTMNRRQTLEFIRAAGAGK